jgi:hypothetical protein
MKFERRDSALYSRPWTETETKTTLDSLATSCVGLQISIYESVNEKG